MIDFRARHDAAALLAALANPNLARLVGALPPRPGQTIAPGALLSAAGLDARQGAPLIGRALALGLLVDRDGDLALNRDLVEATCAALVADGPLGGPLKRHPSLRPFVEHGRVVRWPTRPDHLEELHAMLGELFEPGESLAEPEVNERLAVVVDDYAEVRRGLVDRGLLARTEGAAPRYTVPG